MFLLFIMNCCLQLYNMIHRLHLKLGAEGPRHEKQKNISTDRYQFFVVSSLCSEFYLYLYFLTQSWPMSTT